MKTITKLALVAISIFAIACSKSNTDENPVAPVPDNSLLLTKTERVVTSPIRNLTGYWWCTKLDSGDKFVFHNNDNSNSSAERGMMFYDLATNTFIDKTKCSGVAAVGAPNRLLTDGLGGLWYIAGTFNKYNATLGVWEASAAGSTIFPNSIALSSASTGSITVPSKGRLYYISGFGVKYFDTTNNTWNFAADYPLNMVRYPSLATDNDNKIYAIGGFTGAGINYKKLYYLNIQSNSWTELAEAPELNGNSAALNTMVFFKNHLVYLGADKKLYVYDIATNKWQNTSFDTDVYSVNDTHLELSTDGTKIYLIYKKSNSAIGIQEYK